MRSQLKQADIDKNSSPYHDAEYNYRKDGNLNSRTINSSTTNFTYVGDLMDTASGGEGFDLAWDDNDNMTTGVTKTFTYNWDNKLRSASALSGNIKYDPSGNRVRKLSAAVGDRKYIVDIVGDLPTTLMEMTDNTIRKSLIYANGQVLCQHNGSHSAPRYFYTHDRLGSVRQIINTSGNVVRYYTYEPFGEVLEEDGTLTNNMMFTGQYFDTEIDQYYLRARQYDPHISRFTARDPVFGQYKEPLTLHRYLYCLNDPINCIDPGGLTTWHIMGSGLFSLGFPSLMYQTGVVWDDKGNWGWITTKNDVQPDPDPEAPPGQGRGLGFGIPAAGIGGAYGKTDADTIFDLEDPGMSVGGSFFVVGVDRISGESYKGWETTIGATASAIPGFEAHIHWTWTTVDEWPKSRRDTINEYIDELFENSLYEVQTVGQGYFLLMFWDEMP